MVHRAYGNNSHRVPAYILVEDLTPNGTFVGGEWLFFNEAEKTIAKVPSRGGLVLKGLLSVKPHAVLPLKSGIRAVTICYCNVPILKFCDTLRKLEAAGLRQQAVALAISSAEKKKRAKQGAGAGASGNVQPVPFSLPAPDAEAEAPVSDDFLERFATALIGSVDATIDGKRLNTPGVLLGADPESHLLRDAVEYLETKCDIGHSNLLALAFFCTNFNLMLVDWLVTRRRDLLNHNFPDLDFGSGLEAELTVMQVELKCAWGTARFQPLGKDDLFRVLNELAHNQWDFNVDLHTFATQVSSRINGVGYFYAMVASRQLRFHGHFEEDCDVDIGLGSKAILVNAGVGTSKAELRAAASYVRENVGAVVMRLAKERGVSADRERVYAATIGRVRTRLETEGDLCEVNRIRRRHRAPRTAAPGQAAAGHQLLRALVRHPAHLPAACERAGGHDQDGPGEDGAGRSGLAAGAAVQLAARDLGRGQRQLLPRRAQGQVLDGAGALLADLPHDPRGDDRGRDAQAGGVQGGGTGEEGRGPR